uniref:Uncharacterized protein n=1 Tax=Daphnia magna TaxID=35525 RepID=A0A0N8EG56_9CRUS
MILNIASHCGKFFFICKIYRTVLFYNKVQSFLIEKRPDNFQIAQNLLKLKNFMSISFILPLFVPVCM